MISIIYDNLKLRIKRIVFLELIVVTIGFCKFRMVLRSTCIIVSSKASCLMIRAVDDVGQHKFTIVSM